MTLPLALGCSGEEGLAYAPAAGTVLVNGKPIEGAQVVLTMDKLKVAGPKPTSRGVSDPSGRFELKSLTPDKELVDGAVVGNHNVRITTRLVEMDQLGNQRVVREELLGPQYTAGTKLTVEIPPGGVDDLTFDLPGRR